jgi:hypothetical protein
MHAWIFLVDMLGCSFFQVHIALPDCCRANRCFATFAAFAFSAHTYVRPPDVSFSRLSFLNRERIPTFAPSCASLRVRALFAPPVLFLFGGFSQFLLPLLICHVSFLVVFRSPKHPSRGTPFRDAPPTAAPYVAPSRGNQPPQEHPSRG